MAACTDPTPLWIGDVGSPTRLERPGTRLVSMRCGRCVDCRQAHAAQWAARIHLECRKRPDALFVTFTYRDLPFLGSLNPQHMQKFFKRLRRSLPGVKVKYFYVGEYGDRTQRPHYHAIIWMPRPGDEKLYESGEFPLFRSVSLEKVWGFGSALYGEVTAASGMYTAGYAVKKLFGADDYGDRIPPFLRASQGLGLEGLRLAEFDSDSIMISPGFSVPVPRYILDRLDQVSPVRVDEIRQRRAQSAAEASARPNQPSRASKAIVAKARVDLYRGEL